MLGDYGVFGRGRRSAGQRPIFWQEWLRNELEAIRHERPVVIIPTGSVEQHGPHCPLDVDIVDALAIAVSAAEAAPHLPIVVAPYLDGALPLQDGTYRHDHRPARNLRRGAVRCLPLHPRERLRTNHRVERPWRQPRTQPGDCHQTRGRGYLYSAHHLLGHGVRFAPARVRA
ncbi:MAG: hypothetical protein C4346_07240 [Chloroflexota bacterium]